MRFSFCKNSVFCILFLLFFSLGTICGVLLLHCVLRSDSQWVRAYCTALASQGGRGAFLNLWFLLLPFLAAFAIMLLPGGDKLLPVLFFLRGCVCTYSIGACLALQIPLTGILLRNLFLLPAFYAFSRKLWSYLVCEEVHYVSNLGSI